MPAPASAAPAVSVCVPPPNCTVAPALDVNVPASAPPLESTSVPLAPVRFACPPDWLLNGMLIVVTPVLVFVNVPVLLKLAPPPPVFIVWLFCTLNNPLLSMCAAFCTVMLFALVQLTVPALASA